MSIHNRPDMNLFFCIVYALYHLHSLNNSSVLITRSSSLHAEDGTLLIHFRPLSFCNEHEDMKANKNTFKLPWKECEGLSYRWWIKLKQLNIPPSQPDTLPCLSNLITTIRLFQEKKYAKPNTTGQPFVQGYFSSSGLLGQFSCSDFSYLVKCEFRTWLWLDFE